MRIVLASCLLAVTLVAAATESAPVSEPAEDKAAGKEALEKFLARMDEEAEKVKTLEADMTITTHDIWTKKDLVRTASVFVSKPDLMHIDFPQTDKQNPRKIWISKTEIVDHYPANKSMNRIALSEDAKKPQILGISTKAAELTEQFDLTLEEPSDDAPQCYLLTLVPKDGVKVRFTSAEVEVDATTFLPRSIKEIDDNLQQTKTFAFANVKKNPLLRSRLFNWHARGSLARGTVIPEKSEERRWKGL